VSIFVFFASGVNAAAPSTVELPDYTKWDMILDHSDGPYLYKNKEIFLHDRHYTTLNKDLTEKYVVVVFYRPEDDKPWFAVYATLYKDPRKALKVYLCEANKDNKWVLVLDISGLEDLVQIFKPRYGLEYVEPGK
jgi:hypothetical protein